MRRTQHLDLAHAHQVAVVALEPGRLHLGERLQLAGEAAIAPLGAAGGTALGAVVAGEEMDQTVALLKIDHLQDQRLVGKGAHARHGIVSSRRKRAPTPHRSAGSNRVGSRLLVPASLAARAVPSAPALRVLLVLVARAAGRPDDPEDRRPGAAPAAAGAAAALQNGEQLVVTGARADLGTGLLVITGIDFGNSPPRVTLGLQDLDVFSAGPDRIEAILPAEMTPGSYLLIVARGDGPHDYDVFDVAIPPRPTAASAATPGPATTGSGRDAVATPGPAGPAGPTGPQRASRSASPPDRPAPPVTSAVAALAGKSCPDGSTSPASTPLVSCSAARCRPSPAPARPSPLRVPSRPRRRRRGRRGRSGDELPEPSDRRLSRRRRPRRFPSSPATRRPRG